MKNKLRPLTKHEKYLNRLHCRDPDYRSTAKIELQQAYQHLKSKNKFGSEYPFASLEDWKMFIEKDSILNKVLVLLLLIVLLIFMPFCVVYEYKQYLKLKADLKRTTKEYKLRYISGEHYLNHYLLD